MTYKLYSLENGFNKSAIMRHARELLASGMFDKWQITKRERWGRCLKAAWNSAKHERYSVQFKAEQARISAYLEAKRIAEEAAEAEEKDVEYTPHVFTAQELIDYVYKTAGTAD